jgi:rhodanese-related sulfurtransferase
MSRRYSSQAMASFSDTDFDLTPERAKELVESGEAQLVDVRENYEWEAGRIADAVHIELERLPGSAAEIDKDKPVIFQCRLGRRSAFAVEAFRNGGYDAYNMTGGIQAWADAGLPLEPEGGTVADH